MPVASPNANVIDDHARRASSFRDRAILILLLIPLLAASWGLHKSMPRSDLRAEFDGRRPFVYWENVQNFTFLHVGNPHEAKGAPISLMNVDTGEITAATRTNLVWHGGVNSRGERVVVRSNDVMGTPAPSVDRRTAYFKNMETGEERRVEFDWPYEQTEVVNSRFAVSRDRNSIYAIDLEDAQPQAFSIASPYAGTDLSVKAIYGTELLYEEHPPSQSNSTLHKLELFKLADHQIQLVKTLEIGSPFSGITKLNGQLLTLSPGGRSVEFRSLNNLEFLKAIDISEQFLATHDVVDLQGNLVLGFDKQTFNLDYYDIFSKEQLKLPFSGMSIRCSSSDIPDIRYWCFGGGVGWREKYAYVYDLQERRTCLTVPYDCSQVAFLEDGRFAVSHPAYGVCTVVYDLKTGKSIRHAPHQWFAVALVATLLAWFGWWVTWLVVSAREGSWLWDDLAMIFGILPAILTYLGVGELFPHLMGFLAYSTNFAILHGVFIGLLCVSALFFSLSNTRRSVALLPLTLVFAAFNWWLGSIAPRPRAFHTYPKVCLIVTMIVVATAACGMLMRRLGGRMKKPLAAESAARNKPAQLSLLDLFILIACAGIVMAASKPLVVPLPKLSLQLLFDRYWLPTTLAASAISFVVILAVLNQRKWAAKFGSVLAAIVWCCLIIQQVLTFAGFPARLFAIDPTAVQTIVVASTSAYICAHALRLRSYRLGRL